MSADLMRSEFESWMSDGGEFPKAVQRSADGQGYLLMVAQSAWVAWQAAWNRRAPLPAEQPSNPVPMLDERQLGNLKRAIRALRIESHETLAICMQEILERIVGQQTKGGGNG